MMTVSDFVLSMARGRGPIERAQMKASFVEIYLQSGATGHKAAAIIT